MDDKYLTPVGKFIKKIGGWPVVTGFIVAFALGLWAGSAASATLSYTAPTSYIDGSPLPASAITGYEFRCGAGTTAGITCTPLSLPGTATGGTMVITGPATGFTACIEGRTLVALGPGPYSSPPFCKTYAAVPPGPPGNVTIAVVIGINVAPVYTITAAGARSTALAGFVPVGVACYDDVVFTYRGKSWRRVDVEDVRWWKTTPTPNVAAPCAST